MFENTPLFKIQFKILDNGTWRVSVPSDCILDELTLANKLYRLECNKINSDKFEQPKKNYYTLELNTGRVPLWQQHSQPMWLGMWSAVQILKATDKKVEY